MPKPKYPKRRKKIRKFSYHPPKVREIKIIITKSGKVRIKTRKRAKRG